MPAHVRERMTGRERVVATLTHRIPDRVPLDFGGSLAGIHEAAYETLVDHLGLRHRVGPVQSWDALQRLAAPDEVVLDRLHIDTRYLPLRSAARRSVHVREVVRNARAWHETEDEFGVRWSMPADGTLSGTVSLHPLANATLEQIRDYPFPNGADPARFAGLREYALEVSRFGANALVTDAAGSLLETCSQLRGPEQWLCDLHSDPTVCERLLDRALEFWSGWFDSLLDEVGDLVDVVTVADDLAGQRGPLFSPAAYRRLVRPRQQRLIRAIRARTQAIISYHSCGAFLEYVPDLSALGVDVLNPAAHAEGSLPASALKRRFGTRLSFWGGSFELDGEDDEQAARTTRARVSDALQFWMPGGGYVFSIASNVQPGVAPANVVASYDAAHELGVYAIPRGRLAGRPHPTRNG